MNVDEVPMINVGHELPAFINALVPAQAKAIANLRLLSATLYRLDTAKLPGSEALKNMKMQLNFEFRDSDHILQRLENFAVDRFVRSLVEFNLKAFRIELGLDGLNVRDRVSAGTSGRTVRLLNTDDAKIFEEVLERIQIDLSRRRSGPEIHVKMKIYQHETKLNRPQLSKQVDIGLFHFNIYREARHLSWILGECAYRESTCFLSRYQNSFRCLYRKASEVQVLE